MSIRFAAARSRVCSIVARTLTVPPLARAANDTAPDPVRNDLLVSALRHFARHGLAAAATAAAHAETAAGAGDPVGHAHWRAVCAMFDRQLADSLRPAAPPIKARGGPSHG